MLAFFGIVGVIMGLCIGLLALKGAGILILAGLNYVISDPPIKDEAYPEIESKTDKLKINN